MSTLQQTHCVPLAMRRESSSDPQRVAGGDRTEDGRRSSGGGGDDGKVLTLKEVLDRLAHLASEEEAVTIKDIMEEFSGRLFGPTILVPGLIMVTPVGALPFVPAIIGLLLVLMSGQQLFNRSHPWIPGFIGKREVPSEKLEKSVKMLRPWAKRVDVLLKPRWSVLVEGPMRYVISGLVVLLGIALPVVSLLPFASLAPGAAVSLFGLALTGRDGVVASVGYVATAVAAYLMFITFL